jgi:molybdate transport system regulatory protein
LKYTAALIAGEANCISRNTMFTKQRTATKRRDAWEARPRWRLSRGETIALGPGKADLLGAIDRAGSISAGARAMGMSYRRAWLLVDTMNQSFIKPLVATSKWRGEGARLTPEGKTVLQLFRRLETRSLTTGRPLLAELRKLLKSTRAGSARLRSTQD